MVQAGQTGAFRIAFQHESVGNLRLLTAGLTRAVIGMGWLRLVSPGDAPWLPVGLRQVLTLNPLTSAGIARVALPDAGAAALRDRFCALYPTVRGGW